MTLLQQCEEYLKSIGFVVDENNPGYSYVYPHHQEFGRYTVNLLEATNSDSARDSKLAAMLPFADEKGDVILGIDVWSGGDVSPVNTGVLIKDMACVRCLIEGTREWRRIKLIELTP